MEIDLFKIPTIKIIIKANAYEQDPFTYPNQLNVEEPETYNRAMNQLYLF